MVEIENEALLKSMVVVEFLQDQGRFARLLKATGDAVGRPIGEVIAAFEAGLGQSLHAFEKSWRAWLVNDQQQSIVERLGRTRTAKNSDPVAAVVGRLAKIRAAALVDPSLRDTPPVESSSALSTGALQHARYLSRNPAQAEKWPDVHEQFADRA